MKRTEQQNKALHKFCREAAKQLNMSGHTIETVLFGNVLGAIDGVCKTLEEKDLDWAARLVHDAVYKNLPRVEVSWTVDNFKEAIWHFFQRKLFGTESTADMTTAQVNMVYEDVNAFLGQISNGEIDIQFPSEEEK